MPKKPRQAHIPPQAIKHRRVRRPFMQGETPSEGFATAASAAAVDSFAAEMPATSIPTVPVRRRRLDAVRGPAEAATAYRAVPGQLPTFDRVYLMRELRQIAWISTSLLALIIILAIVLR